MLKHIPIKISTDEFDPDKIKKYRTMISPSPDLAQYIDAIENQPLTNLEKIQFDMLILGESTFELDLNGFCAALAHFNSMKK